MDELKPQDELKPDASDRRLQRASSAPRVPVSRQHMTMGIGILVLLLLVIGIGSALNSPDGGNKKQSPPAGGEKNIDITGPAPAVNQSNTSGATASNTASGQMSSGNGPQPISVPPVSSKPTEAQIVPAPENQQRVELPGDLNSALNNQQGQVDVAAQNMTSLPTAPATVTPANSPPARPAVSKPPQHVSKPAAPAKTAMKHTAPVERHSSSATSHHVAKSSEIKSAQAGNYTLQLSSASHPETLKAWAEKQNLSNYHVYQTTRSGQPWYVLVSGSYATPADARQAVASLPADVRAKNPWVKTVSQIKKEAAK